MNPADMNEWLAQRDQRLGRTPTAAEARVHYGDAYTNPKHPLYAEACQVVRELTQAECRAAGVDPNAPASHEGFGPAVAPVSKGLFR